MLNFYTWSNNNYEIVLEGNSFYFAQKMCVAFRKKKPAVDFCARPAQ
jgi:hypothetical protein